MGGTCIELEFNGKRILLDLGMPLHAQKGEVPLPDVSGLRGEDPNLLGVVISHLHGDHCGLVPHAHPKLPVAIGSVAARILQEATFFNGRAFGIVPRWSMQDRRPFRIGPFDITPYQVEHSAPDAFALLVEADGRRLFYTGDFRAHGNDTRPFERMLRSPPKDVHALLMEGTQIGDGRQAKGPSEAELRAALENRFREWRGLVLVAWSAQNLDRLRTVREAAVRSGRMLVIDLYAATLASVAASPGIPRLGDPGLAVYCRRREALQVLAARQFERTEAVKRWRIFRERLVRRRKGLVLVFRPSMVEELARAGVLDGALLIWSLWQGYLDRPEAARMRATLRASDVPFESHHVSGHAYVRDLQRLVTRLAPGRVVPVHSDAPDRYAHHFPRVERMADGVWWCV